MDFEVTDPKTGRIYDASDSMKVSEVAGLFRVDTKTVGRWADNEKIFCFRTAGGHRRYPREAVREVIEEAQQQVRLGSLPAE